VCEPTSFGAMGMFWEVRSEATSCRGMGLLKPPSSNSPGSHAHSCVLAHHLSVW
jgi:hypothetical protein